MPRSLRFRLRHALLLSVLALLGAGAAGPALGAQTPDAWPQVGGDPSHAATASTPGPPYRRAWTTQIAGGGAAAGPVVAGETIVVVGWDRVVALRLSDGGQTWSVEREPGPAGPPAVVEEQVIHAEGLGRLGAVVALSLEDGSEVWRHDVGTAIVGGITVVPDGAIVGGRDGSIRLLDPETGDERWARDLPGRIETTPTSDGRAIFVLT
ncbi:MAG TPA: PQQ-binding-like beta-propeller repeat protein, partial [Actinomycetota bacterium]|nr:PQQ-binding-like beta-propeller repeat protein [Actinomycetota bacterium]